MIQITTYRDKVGRLGGLGKAVISNLMPRWPGQGPCFPTNEHQEN